MRRVVTYGIVSRALAIIVLVAGLAAYHQFLTIDYDQLSVTHLSFATAEIVFGIWLLFGFYPDYSRLVLVAFFLLMANIVFSQMLAEKDSCGCFGRFLVRPWIVFAIDLSALGLLLFLPGGEPKPFNPRLMRIFAGLAGAVIVAGFSAIVFRMVPWEDTTDPQAPIPHRKVRQICKSIEQNYTSFVSLEFELKKTTKSPGASGEKRIIKDAKGSTIATIFTPVRIEQSYRYIIRGDDVRRDSLDEFSRGAVAIISRGRELHFDPKTRRAVARDADMSTGAEPIDPRSLGFETPLISVSDWLRRHKLISVKDYQSESDQGISVRAVVSMPRAHATLETEWVVRFSAQFNFLPVSIDEYSRDGSHLRQGRYTYEKLPDGSAWFLKSLTIERWAAKAGMRNPVTILEYEVIGPPLLDKPITDSTFDMKFAPDTSIVVAPKMLHAMNSGPAKSFFALLPENSKELGSVRRYWPYVGGLNLVIFLLALWARRYIKL
jgi:hypothetical protein